jgi:ADP-heptose:LPS heptosyltransferase
MSLIKRSIPLEDRTIKLKVDIQDFTDLLSLCDINELKNLVLIHPGKWWESKTFPIEWWQNIIDILANENIPVGIIGKTVDEKQGYLPVVCPENGYDFRDMTSLGAMIALISQAPILITNDSSPIHIAGAFDNWIITFATAKASYNILPYRKSTQLYKTMSLEKKLLLNDLDVLWLSNKPQTIAELPINMDWNNYLPDPEFVVQKIKGIYKI